MRTVLVLLACAPALAASARAAFEDPPAVSSTPIRPGDAGTGGTVALLSHAFVLERATARELAPAARERVWLVGRSAEELQARREKKDEPGETREPRKPQKNGKSADPTIQPVAIPDPLRESEAPLARFELDSELQSSPDVDDRALCERVGRAGCIVLTGGTWVEWNTLLRPQGKFSRLGATLQSAREAGTAVVAADGAAKFLVRWSSVARADIGRESRNPHDTDPEIVVQGLNFVRDLELDVAAPDRTSAGVLLAGVARGGIDLALWMDGDAAWIVSSRGDARVEGSGVVFVFDLADARRSRHDLREGRLSMLGSGARWDGRHRRTAATPDTPADVPLPRPISAEAPRPAETAVADVLDAAFLRGLFSVGPGRASATQVGVEAVYVDARHTLRLRRDERSRFVPDGWTQIVFDLVLSRP